MKQEKFKKRLTAGFLLALAMCFGWFCFLFARAAVGCFYDATRLHELYPWLVSKGEPGWEDTLHRLEDEQAAMLLYGVFGVILALFSLIEGTFLARQGWKKWENQKCDKPMKPWVLKFLFGFSCVFSVLFAIAAAGCVGLCRDMCWYLAELGEGSAPCTVEDAWFFGRFSALFVMLFVLFVVQAKFCRARLKKNENETFDKL